MFSSVGVKPERLWAVGEPLDPSQCRTGLTGELPTSTKVESETPVSIKIENLSESIYSKTPPHPVLLSYRWQSSSDPSINFEGERVSLRQALPPKQSAETQLSIKAPATSGQYSLSISLLQEGIHWFDQVDPANGLSQMVEVTS